MYAWLLAFVIALAALINGRHPDIEDLRNVLQGTKLFVKYRNYFKTYLSRAYLCENYQPTKRKHDNYDLIHQYNMSGKWYTEHFTASLSPEKSGYSGPIMTVYERWPAVCNMLIWSDNIDKVVPECDSFYATYCGHRKYAIYNRTCLPALQSLWRQGFLAMAMALKQDAEATGSSSSDPEMVPWGTSLIWHPYLSPAAFLST
ncbi:uncharacterized protein [Dermacentor albipictus]|uniref:uncharacterized protein n=1 Tax=Dermacentor albipictus TaxID=60249 RepID=UPI0031FC79D8